MSAKIFVSVQFTTKTEPTLNDPLVLDKTHYQRNAVVQLLAAQLGNSLSQQSGRDHLISGTKKTRMAPID